MSHVNHKQPISRELGLLKKVPAHNGPQVFQKGDFRRSRELGRGIAAEGEKPLISAGGGIGGGPTGSPTPPGDFGAAVRAWVQDVTNRRLPSAQRAITYQLFLHVLNYSPVASGAFMSSWKFRSGEPDTTHISKEQMRVLNATDNPGAFAQKVAELENFISGLHGGTNWKLYMTNGIPYARRVEYVGWHNTTAYAPIRKAMRDLSRIIEQVLSEKR